MSRFTTAVSNGLRGYAAWLVSISWKRFVLLSILAMIIAGVLSGLPPFTWRIGGDEAAEAQQPGSLAAEIKREITEELQSEFGVRRAGGFEAGDVLPELALLFIFVSAAIKVAYAGRAKAEAPSSGRSTARR